MADERVIKVEVFDAAGKLFRTEDEAMVYLAKEDLKVFIAKAVREGNLIVDDVNNVLEFMSAFPAEIIPLLQAFLPIVPATPIVPERV